MLPLLNLYIKLGYIIFAIDSFYLLAISAQNERDFCQVGLIRTARRAQMSAKKLSDVELLNSVVKMGFLNSHDAYT